METEKIIRRAERRKKTGENPYRIYADAKNIAGENLKPSEYEAFIRRLCDALGI